MSTLATRAGVSNRPALAAGRSHLVRFAHGGSVRWGVASGDAVRPLPLGLDALLALPVGDARRTVERSTSAEALPLDSVTLLAPLDVQEVWAAGVTYERSREARIEESGQDALYTRAYEGERPELFLKATPTRVVADGEAVGVRRDSAWNAPEPELALVLTQRLDLFGFAIANDVSSRSIEGDNALHLPQAKIYDRACALGPSIVPAWELGTGHFTIELEIARAGATVFAGQTSTERLRRSWSELAGWVGRALSFPNGVILLTGTGIVPGPDVTLREEDVVTITVPELGRLRNPVVAVGS